MNRNTLAVLSICIFLACGFEATMPVFAQEQQKKATIPDVIRELKKTVVFVGTITAERGEKIPLDGFLLSDINPKNIRFNATAFLVDVQGISHLVTAKHVVKEFMVTELRDGKAVQRLNDVQMFIFFNKKDGRVGFRSIGHAKTIHSVDWIFHEDPKVDLAIIPFPINKTDDDITVMPDIMISDTSKLQELYDVFFIVYQPGAESQKRIAPVMRTGMISSINEDKTFYIDGFAFPGNSGSPVFFKYDIKRFSETDRSFNIGADSLGGMFIGIIGEYVPYQEVATSTQTKRARVIFEENTGLSRVWSTGFLKDIEESPKFRQQIKTVHDKLQKK